MTLVEILTKGEIIRNVIDPVPPEASWSAEGLAHFAFPLHRTAQFQLTAKKTLPQKL